MSHRSGMHERLGAAEVDRRTFLRAAAAGGAGVVLSAAGGAAWVHGTVARKKRVYVLVVDGCRPDEVTPTLMPRLAALRAEGRSYPRARSLPIMETIPNHVMMMTGVRPRRSGVPANAVYDRRLAEVRELDRPGDLQFPTVLERLGRRRITSGTVLSKEYLFGIFGKRATYRWEPEPIVPVSGHAPDQFTMDATLAMVREADPNLVFVNLGDCDRVGHADLTGTTLAAARTAALRSVDTQVGRLVDLLKSSRRWRSSVVVVLADHSMDWSYPHKLVSLAPVFKADPLLAGRVEIAQNGGADLLYWTGPAASCDDALQRMRVLARRTDGVLAVKEPGALGLGDQAGDLVAYCRSGWRFSDPAPVSNPIPGNHGHPATGPIPFFITGGSRLVRRRTTSSREARTIDVAPTVSEVFGLDAPRGGYDGVSRL